MEDQNHTEFPNTVEYGYYHDTFWRLNTSHRAGLQIYIHAVIKALVNKSLRLVLYEQAWILVLLVVFILH